MLIILIASSTTATFAWFSMNTVVTIDGIYFMAKVTDELRVAPTASGLWSYRISAEDLSINNMTDMLPVTYIGGNLFENSFKEVKDINTFVGTSYYTNKDLFQDAQVDVNYFVAELWFRATSAQKLYIDDISYMQPRGDLIISGVNKDYLAGAVRLGIFNELGDCILVWAPNASIEIGYNDKGSYVVNNNGTNVDNNTIYYDTEEYIFISTLGSNMQDGGYLLVEELSENQPTLLYMVFWIEGEDPEAQTILSGGRIDVMLSFTGDPLPRPAT